MIRALLPFWLCGMLVVNAASTAGRPDIVVFITDDQSQLDLSPYGDVALRTPNMQRLADGGMKFTAAYAASPTCAPSRGAFLTGLMPARNGAEPNHAAPRSNIKKWPAYFQELGYEVVAFGKVAHYDQTKNYGFDYCAHTSFHDDVAASAAVDYLKNRPRAGAKPLCLLVGSNWPHVPWPEKDLDYDPDQLRLPATSIDTPATRAWRARYAAAVTRADDDLGIVLNAAHACLGTNTICIFFSDQGAQWPFGKWNCYEAGVRVPLMFVWPGVTKPGAQTGALVSLVDVLPTLIEAVGGKPPRDMDGRSFVSVLKGKRTQHHDRVFTTHSGDGNWNIYPTRAVREGDWKYIRNLHPEFAFTTHIDLPGNLGQRSYFSTWEAAGQTNAEAAAIVQRYHARPAEELYDLSADPYEQHNLASDPAGASKLKKLRREVDGWMRRQSDQQKVYGEPRLLSDPKSFGPNAPSGNAWPARTPRKGQPAAQRKKSPS